MFCISQGIESPREFNYSKKHFKDNCKPDLCEIAGCNDQTLWATPSWCSFNGFKPTDLTSSMTSSNICNARSVWNEIFFSKIELFFDFNPSKWSLNNRIFWSKYMFFSSQTSSSMSSTFSISESDDIDSTYAFNEPFSSWGLVSSCTLSSAEFSVKKHYRSRSSDLIFSIIHRRLFYLHVLVIISPTNRPKKKSPYCSRRSRDVLECHFTCNLWIDSIMTVKSICNSISRSSRNFTSSLKEESHEKRSCDMSTHISCVILK